ncbi:unnamed protein product, partial [marine sediment metagenome]
MVPIPRTVPLTQTMVPITHTPKNGTIKPAPMGKPR